ncbi:MAG: hypothetical protein QXR19_05875 [Candidatus Jordarchaeaceae archaeon]
MMNNFPYSRSWGFDKLRELKKDGLDEKEKKKLFRKLEKIAQKIEDAIGTFPKANICILNTQGKIFYCSRAQRREILEFISDYVQKNHESYPKGSYAIPRSDLSLIIWKLSDNAAITIYTEGGLGALLSKTPYIMHFSKKIDQIVVKLSSLPTEECLMLYEKFMLGGSRSEILRHEIFSPVFQTNEQKSKLLEVFNEVELKVLEEIDGKKTVQEIAEKTGIPLELVRKTIQRGISQSIVKRVKQYPLIKRLDRGSLLLFGIDPSYINFYKELRRLCNGKRTLEEIASLLEIPETKLVNILERVGNSIEWLREVE